MAIVKLRPCYHHGRVGKRPRCNGEGILLRISAETQATIGRTSGEWGHFVEMSIQYTRHAPITVGTLGPTGCTAPWPCFHVSRRVPRASAWPWCQAGGRVGDGDAFALDGEIARGGNGIGPMRGHRADGKLGPRKSPRLWARGLGVVSEIARSRSHEPIRGISRGCSCWGSPPPRSTR